MIQEYQVRVQPHLAANEQALRNWLADEYGFDVRTLTAVRILRRSIDARQRTIFVNLKVRCYINEQPQQDEYVVTHYPDVSSAPQAIVVGAGPGGLFAALRLIELGLRPIVLERGKDVRERKKDLALIAKTQQVDGESNYCFGEGGAGAYSDGKLYTRSKKRGSIEKILNVFCQHGASTNILADAHPHIGTDKLPRVIENMRNTILQCGGEVHFQTKVTRLILEGCRVVGRFAADKEYLGPVILATGHSARDVYRYLHREQIAIEAKGIAVGVRLEHLFGDLLLTVCRQTVLNHSVGLSSSHYLVVYLISCKSYLSLLCLGLFAHRSPNIGKQDIGILCSLERNICHRELAAELSCKLQDLSVRLIVIRTSDAYIHAHFKAAHDKRVSHVVSVAYVAHFQILEGALELTDSHKVCKHLTRVAEIGQTVYYRDRTVLS